MKYVDFALKCRHPLDTHSMVPGHLMGKEYGPSQDPSGVSFRQAEPAMIERAEAGAQAGIQLKIAFGEIKHLGS